MKEIGIETRSIEREQLTTVTRLFIKEGIDLSLVGAGRSLYQSLRNAKWRTKNREDYIAKNIEYMFKQKDRLTLLEIIQVDKEFWQAWIKQHEVFERTGLDSDNASIHRINPDGNYEFGNIAVLPYGEHQQEHAEPTALFTSIDGILSTQFFGSNTTMARVIGVGTGKVKNMAKRSYEVVDKDTGVGIGQVAIAMPVRILEPTNSEEEYKAQCEAYGIHYKPLEARREREKKQILRVEQQYKEMCEIKGIEWISPERRGQQVDASSLEEDDSSLDNVPLF